MSQRVVERHQRIERILREGGPKRLVDLAAALGVSAVTVRRDVDQLAGESRVRRMHGSVGLPLAAMALQDTGITIGMVVPHADYYFADVIAGVRSVIDEVGARLVLGVSNYDALLERQLTDRFVENGAHGLLLVPTPDFSTGHLAPEQQAWLSAIPIPTVLVERSVAPGGGADSLDQVGTAHGVGAASAVRHLASLGHTSIGLLTHRGPGVATILAGARTAAAATGIRVVGELSESDLELRAVSDALVQWIRDGVTALFVHNDRLALGVLETLSAAGMAVPGDVSVICYDDITAELANPPLSAVAPPRWAVGQHAARLVIARAGAPGTTGGHLPPISGREHRAFVPTLRARGSTVNLAFNGSPGLRE